MDAKRRQGLCMGFVKGKECRKPTICNECLDSGLCDREKRKLVDWSKVMTEWWINWFCEMMNVLIAEIVEEIWCAVEALCCLRLCRPEFRIGSFFLCLFQGMHSNDYAMSVSECPVSIWFISLFIFVVRITDFILHLIWHTVWQRWGVSFYTDLDGRDV